MPYGSNADLPPSVRGQFRGLSPWVKDFRSPLPIHPQYQDYYNRKD